MTSHERVIIRALLNASRGARDALETLPVVDGAHLGRRDRQVRRLNAAIARTEATLDGADIRPHAIIH